MGIMSTEKSVDTMFWSTHVAGALAVGNKKYQVQVLQICTENILHPHQDQHFLSFQQLHLLLSLHLFFPPPSPYAC